jgi:hypothetical protein
MSGEAIVGWNVGTGLDKPLVAAKRGTHARWVSPCSKRDSAEPLRPGLS